MSSVEYVRVVVQPAPVLRRSADDKGSTDDSADLVAAWTVVREAFGTHDVPSSLMGVTALGYADQLVEIEAVAAVID